MFLKITQKYWTLNEKFALTDEYDRPVFYACGKVFKLRSNLDLFALSGAPLYHLEAELWHFFSHFIISSPSGQQLGLIAEKMHMPGFRRARMKLGNVDIKIKGGPIHMKAFVKGANGKWDKKHPVVRSSKKMFRVRDIYAAEIDEHMIDPAIGAVVAIWYDKIRYGHKH